MRFDDLQRPAGSPLIMGILNVTPDSFSDGGQYRSLAEAVDAGIGMVDEGAAILDIGGESTRPASREYGEGFARVNENEEITRVLPVIEGVLAARPDAFVSIDTVKPAVAEAAVAAGAGMINDVAAGQYDKRIWQVAAENSVIYVAMHGHDPQDERAVEDIRYDDPTGSTYRWLFERVTEIRQHGVANIVVDPGIGFSKGAPDSARVIRELWRLSPIGLPILIGLSRKSLIGRTLGGLPVDERLYGSLGAAAAAAMNGASILRVHDVRETIEFFRLFSLLRD